MKKVIFLLLSILMLSSFSNASKVSSDERSEKEIKGKLAHLRIPFVKNVGQKNKAVKFYAKTFGGTLFVTKDGKLVYSIPKFKDNNVEGGVALREILKGAKIKQIEGLKKATAKVNYFIGKDKSKWKTNIETYNMVSLGEVYKGIELKLKAYGNNVEKIFEVKPKSNPEEIVLKIEGAKKLKIDKKTGELIAKTELGDVKFTKPVAYQEIDGKKVNVKVKYKLLSKNSYKFKVGDYDRTKTLIIDPLLASTFLGGSDNDEAKAIVLDTDSVYIAGTTWSTDYPTTTGSYDEGHNGDADAYISKLDKNLTTLQASTFIGGSDFDEANAIALDTDSVYIAGGTDSTDYPTTTGSYDNSYNNFGDAYISKLDKNLTILQASTFIGGSDLDRANAIALDTDSVYIAGWTWSIDYPTTTGSYDEDYNGSTDAYISKLNKNLTTLQASTFIGGSNQDEAYAIALDADSVYIAGGTRSINYPTTTGSYDEDYNGTRDVYISKLNKNLTILQASTFIGGSDFDRALTIALDTDSVYIAGGTDSTDYPTTTGSYDEDYNGTRDVYISKLNKNLTILQASTFIGGSGFDQAKAIALDTDSVYIAGATWSTNYPTTTGSYDEDYNGFGDAYISKLNKNLTILQASTFIGGGDLDRANAIALDTDSVYIAGATWSIDYPTTTGSYDEDYNDSTDAYISKLNKNLSALVQYTLTVVITGDGTVTSNPVGIDCGTDCSESYDEGTVVTLTATPDTGSIFAGWTGDCNSCGSSLVCSITMDSDKTCEAVFESLYTLTVNKSGSGDGTVTSNPVGIDCGTDCSESYVEGTVVILTATPDTGSIFVRWGDDCSSCGTDTTCNVTIDADKICNAEFEPAPVENGRMYGNYTIGTYPNIAYVNSQIPCSDGSGAYTMFSMNFMSDYRYNFIVAYNLNSVTCYDDPSFDPMKPVDFDTTVATLEGTMNYSTPVIVEIEESDGGEPGTGRDYVHITVIDQITYTVIYEIDGMINGGSVYAALLY